MAISGSGATATEILTMSASSLPPQLRRHPVSNTKVHLGAFAHGQSSNLMHTPSLLRLKRQGPSWFSTQTSALSSKELSPITQDVEGFLHNVVNLSILDRLKLAWRVIFLPPAAKENSNARTAKQRLKMVLFSDRCEVSGAAKKKIVKNIVEALSEFVEIESRDSVQVDISTGASLGTVYSVTVPVRRVKPEYQESEEQHRGEIVGVEYRDTRESSGTVDVTFGFSLPNKNY